MLYGDSAWGALTQLRQEEIDQYLEDRYRRGFNAILVELMEHHFSTHAPSNAYGVQPLKVRGDFSTPDDQYFDQASYILSRARQCGIAVLLTPAYLGYDGGDEGWYREMKASGPSTMRGFGRYVATRFEAFDNVIWVQGGDYDPPDLDLVRAVAEGIREALPAAIQTYHGRRGSSALDVLGYDEPWLNVNSIYTDEHSVVEHATREYARSKQPLVLLEAGYEGSKGADDRVVRLQAYQAVLSGLTGQIMGNNPLWIMGQGWDQHLDSPGARSITVLRRLLEPLPWWKLAPDNNGSFLLTGAGSGVRAVAAVAIDGSMGLVYTPSIRALSVDLRRLRGPHVQAQWYDPVNGRFVDAAPNRVQGNAVRVFVPPTLNARGHEDWALLLQSIP